MRASKMWFLACRSQTALCFVGEHVKDMHCVATAAHLKPSPPRPRRPPSLPGYLFSCGTTGSFSSAFARCAFS